MALIGAGRYDEALVAADRAAGILPGDEHPQRLRAIALKGAGDTKAALAAAEQAAAIAPDSVLVQSVLAQCQLAARRRADAEVTARQVVANAPDWAHGWEVLGDVLLKRRRKAEAIDAYREALRLQPGSASALNRLGAALLAAKQRDEAATHFAQAARADPHDQASRSNLELVTQVGGGFVFFLAFRVVVQSVGGWARVAMAVCFLIAGLVIVFVVREARTSRLPDDAQRYVRAQRTARRRRLANPRNWWPVIAANPLRIAVIVGFAALVVVVRRLRPDPQLGARAGDRPADAGGALRVADPQRRRRSNPPPAGDLTSEGIAVAHAVEVACGCVHKHRPPP